MSEEFAMIEIPFEELDISKTMEDEFLETRINKEVDAATNIEELREAAKKLVKIATAIALKPTKDARLLPKINFRLIILLSLNMMQKS